mgnify:CR=1 FL=1
MGDLAHSYGLDMTVHHHPLGFSYGDEVTGPMPEIRQLDDIRTSLRDPHCEGPQEVYAIAMDVARMQDREELKKMDVAEKISKADAVIWRGDLCGGTVGGRAGA